MGEVHEKYDYNRNKSQREREREREGGGGEGRGMQGERDLCILYAFFKYCYMPIGQTLNQFNVLCHFRGKGGHRNPSR